MDLYNKQGMYDRALSSILQSKVVLKENKQTILRFVDYLRSENLSISRITRYFNDLKKLDGLLRKPFEKATKEDIRRVVAELNNLPLSEASKKEVKILIRKLYCFLRGVEKKGDYPDEVKWMTLNLPSNHKKLPEELLTEQEIQETIRKCSTARDKALIAVLAESGCRVSEIGTRQIKHIAFEQHGTRITVDGKTGMRKILVINSTPYLQEWINCHPNNHEPEAPLWHNPQKKGFLSYARISHILKRAAKKAGIKKKVHLHLLRHSRATKLASIMSDGQLKTYLGWTAGSKMAATYIHMSGKDTDEAVLRANGIEVKRDVSASALQPKSCLRCKLINEVTNRCCKQCGLILEEQYAQEILKKDGERTKVEEMLTSLLNDEEVIALFKKKLFAV